MTDLTSAKRFGPTSGVAYGVIGLIACAGVSLIALTGEVTEGSVQVALGAAVVAVLLWAYMLRPRIVLDEAGGTVLLRNAFVDWRIPLAVVRVVAVRTVTTVKTDDGRYEGAAVGYPLRKIVRGQTGGTPGRLMLGQAPQTGTWGDGNAGAVRSSRPTDQPLQEFMADQILFAADRARELGKAGGAVQRQRAWPELVALVVTVAAFVVGLLV